ncbi:uncharacterized protein BDR25DRAFT_314418 [Lindgomyces ingoldianus]|uniref:Uncharacterized protein n=1 Tax=Lindgomyces ingoldianus TaxID=673940 RepID=A0ACB6QUW5_9PLEO|nr:uncharacterized protein BDR25DRAFT_314418 [Lindgomyces ingoldianus]KAF2470731.1 hypothetical protein BDR25DRAFT_314418 [Lindgomyces ingoldianus]
MAGLAWVAGRMSKVYERLGKICPAKQRVVEVKSSLEDVYRNWLVYVRGVENWLSETSGWTERAEFNTGWEASSLCQPGFGIKVCFPFWVTSHGALLVGGVTFDGQRSNQLLLLQHARIQTPAQVALRFELSRHGTYDFDKQQSPQLIGHQFERLGNISKESLDINPILNGGRLTFCADSLRFLAGYLVVPIILDNLSTFYPFPK